MCIGAAIGLLEWETANTKKDRDSITAKPLDMRL
jgi:hypothetical protein